MVIKILLLVVFFAGMVAVGISARRHAVSVSGFVLGGRSVGPWLTAFAYGTSYFSAVVFVGYAGQFGWKYGLASTWIGLGNAAIGSLLAWVGVEIMAQSVAAFAGCHARQAGLPVELGFLLGTRRYQCNVESFALGSELRIVATRSLQDESGMGVFECHLDGPGIHAEARLNVFRPPEVARYLEETRS